MRDDMYVNTWSPFNPEWYKDAFDRFISVGDQLFNTDEIIKAGYNIPDPDGSRSSVFRNNAVLNNSFNERILRESLADIYLNSSHKLTASNHDQVNFFQWHGRMEDMDFLPSIPTCQFSIPLIFDDEIHVIPFGTMFISPKQRDIFKRAQMYQRWIKVQDICNNWDIFQWHLMLFINQRVMSEYELYIDEQEILIRFRFFPRWKERNFPVSVYRFETNFSRRVLVSRHLLNNRWDWKVPLEDIGDHMIRTQRKAIVAFNKISDPEIRNDGVSVIDVLGDNLEFVDVNQEEGYLDLTCISQFNKTYLNSEKRDWMWMTIIVPKFFHEYPILSPVDVLHRPYIGDLRPVIAKRNFTPQLVKAELNNEGTLEENIRQVYVDMNGDDAKRNHNGWLSIIRPIVLTDAYEDPMREPMTELVDEIRALRDTTKPVADVLKYFKFYYSSETQKGAQVLEVDQTPFVVHTNTQPSETTFYVLNIEGFTRTRGSTLRVRFIHPVIQEAPSININGVGFVRLNLRGNTIPANHIAIIGWNGEVWEVLDCFLTPDHGFEGGYGFERDDEGRVVYMTDPDTGQYLLDDDEKKIPILVFIPHAPPINNELEPESWLAWMDHIARRIQELQDAQHAFFDKRKAVRDQFMEQRFNLLYRILEGLKGALVEDDYGDWHISRVYEEKLDENGDPVYQTDADGNIIEDADGNPIPLRIIVNSYADWLFPPRDSDETFWDISSSLIVYTQKIVEMFQIAEVLKRLRVRHIWSDPNEYLGQVRFQRPIEENNFWFFEYDDDDKVWRPIERKVTHHFPDVYTIQPPQGGEPEPHKIFKAFLFYSDTMNVLEETREIERPTPTWDEDVLEFHHDRRAIYRDVFMEKFYWMAIRSIYKGMLMTQQRWEVVEYVFENPVYRRFNELFLKTMDPYFKLGLATYLKSEHFEFPFDDAVAKMEEAITLEWNNFRKVTNFEVYLINQWIPSFFDNLVRIMDDWNPEGMIRFRPPATFDLRRIIPILLEIQEHLIGVATKMLEKLDWVLMMLEKEHYNLNIPLLHTLRDSIHGILTNLENTVRFINDLDLYTYSIDDVNNIIALIEKHLELVEGVYTSIKDAHYDVDINNIWESKKAAIENIRAIVDTFAGYIDKIVNLVHGFDMDAFMAFVNDMKTQITPRRENPNDTSLIWTINEFEEQWNLQVLGIRNELFFSTALMQNLFNPNKSYTEEEIVEFMDVVLRVQSNLTELRRRLDTFWRRARVQPTQEIIDMLDTSDELISDFRFNLEEYYEIRTKLRGKMQEIRDIINLFDPERFSDRERSYVDGIDKGMDGVIRALSFIAGVNKRDQAMDHLESIFNYLDKWMEFVVVESTVFEKLVIIVEYPDNDLLLVISEHKNILGAMTDYMERVNEPFIQDTGWPTFSDVYTIDEVSLQYNDEYEPINRGFRYAVGDLVFLPRLGVYKVLEVKGDLFRVKSIGNTGWRDTNFRNPVVQARAYGSISDGNGAGLLVQAIKSTRIHIINDTAIRPTVLRIKHLVSRITEFVQRPNPQNNVDMRVILNTIPTIQKYWEDLIKVFYNHLSGNVRTITTNLVTSINSLIPISEEFMETRSLIDIPKFLLSFESLLRNTWAIGNEMEWEIPEMGYQHEDGKVLYQSWMDFFGRGTTWRDVDRLQELIDESVSLLGDWIIPDDAVKLQEILDDTKSVLSQIDDTLPLLSEYIPRFQSAMNPIQHLIDQLPMDNLHKDEWFRMYQTIPAQRGEGYQIGDVFQIVQESDEVILFQVLEVDDGQVMRIQPLLDYALPYLIWGVMETITMTGDGSGLEVDIFSRVMDLEDSTLLNPAMNDGRHQTRFQENDLMMFKFENIHNLNINYEVFLGGRQLNHIIQRHEDSNNQMHPSKLDVIYINANDVWNLRNSSIFIPARRYFVYRVDELEIKDPGAGYHLAQEVFVDTGAFALRLRVAQLVHEPYKGIAALHPSDGKTVYRGHNPGGEDLEVVPDHMNNIDDEFNVSYYDRIPGDGIDSPATLDPETQHIRFLRQRWDDMDGDPRNYTFMYPSIGMVDVDPCVQRGDPDYHWYQGSRIENSFTGDVCDRWNGLMNVNPPTGTFMPDIVRIPLGQPPKGEYHQFKRILFHNSDTPVDGNLTVPNYSSMPRHSGAWPEGTAGKTIIVEQDETNNGHRMIYRIRTKSVNGFFIFDWPLLADQKWNSIDIDWMNIDWHPMYPNLRHQYPDAPWRTAPSHQYILGRICDGYYEKRMDYAADIKNSTSYIHQVGTNDIACFNWTLFQWEDLTDTDRWLLEMREDRDNEDWGFKLTFLEDGNYAYDMKFYLNKTPDTQTRNEELKRNAIINIKTSLIDEVYIPAINSPVHTGRVLRIRKLFPYEQKETFVIGREGEERYGQKIDFRLSPYIHFRNQLQLADIKIKDIDSGDFYDILDTDKFEVRFKDPRAASGLLSDGSLPTEIHTKIVPFDECNRMSIMTRGGSGFFSGYVWGWNPDFQIHVLGRVVADTLGGGYVEEFIPIHSPNPPELEIDEDIILQFQLFQNDTQSLRHAAITLLRFKTEKVEVYNEGYIKNVTNPYAPLPQEFQILYKNTILEKYNIEVSISKTPNIWSFIESEWILTPEFIIKDHVRADRIYILTDRGRFPLINPSTGLPSFVLEHNPDHTKLTFLSLYRRSEHIQVRSLPYSQRSVYVQRRIPSHGYINLEGKINKPLNKKYFEYWVNGKLLDDEVTLITPSKIFLHGLTSLRNLEIIEINRDHHEFFSDSFLEMRRATEDHRSRPHSHYDYRTYLDGALEGNLKGDNYTLEEQAYLISPVWPQVDVDHPSFKDFPPNVDTDMDILARIHAPEDFPIVGVGNTTFQFLLIDGPTLEGIPMFSGAGDWEQFGWIPISNERIIELFEEEWWEEIETGRIPRPSIISDEDWYGKTTRLYDEYGIQVHNLNEAAYTVHDYNTLHINTDRNVVQILRNKVVYDID